jgi:uncharacterized membrane protein
MASFSSETVAAAVVDRLRAEGAFERCEIEGEAIVSRDLRGNIDVAEKGAAGIGATFGAAAGGLLGLLAGPMGLPLIVVAGAITGGIAGHFAGQAISVADLREVADSLPPGSSAYVAVIDTEHAARLAERFRSEGPANVIDVPVVTELSSVIREGVTGRIRRG